MKQQVTLYELNQLVGEAISLTLPDAYWVAAEVSELREVRGHCYLELVEKDDRSSVPVARASAKCWQNRWSLLRPHFESVAGSALRQGMKVLLKVTASFHELYGFSWIVQDIDPTFTLGDMARKRQEIVRQLQEEGVFDLQKELELPLFANRIAVLSNEHAAGYGDFVRQLMDNRLGLSFHLTLFPVVLQGESVTPSIVSALDEVNLLQDRFDAVVIIRGGGATSDLSGFDTLELAENVANFPLPILTGIGHERDESVVDLVAHRRLKTPTAVAAFLIDHLSLTADRVWQAGNMISACALQRLERERHRLSVLEGRLPLLARDLCRTQRLQLRRLYQSLSMSIPPRLSQERRQVERMRERMKAVVPLIIASQRHRLALLKQTCDLLDPQNLLKKGYSITTHCGKIVRDPGQLQAGEEVRTRVEKGSFTSIIK